MTSHTFQATYPAIVRGRMPRVLYITTLLAMTMSSEVTAKRTVKRKKTELPSWNQTLWEKGMLTSRNTMEKRAAKVTVPIRWFFARRYSGIIFLFFFPSSITRIQSLCPIFAKISKFRHISGRVTPQTEALAETTDTGAVFTTFILKPLGGDLILHSKH